MIYLCTDVSKFCTFLEVFSKKYETIQLIDVSKVPLANLADNCESIVSHHKDCCVFLGYLEPGWMLEPCNQTRIRKLIRKFPVGLVLQFPESLPYSWKNEIDIIYTFNDLNNHG
jgi:hypothetical protein